MFSSNKNAKGNYKPVSISEGYDSDNSYDDEEDFIQRQIRQQKMEYKKQDEGLEMLSESANRLGTLSLGISEELGQQNR